MPTKAKHIITITKRIHLHKVYFVPGPAKRHRMLLRWRSHQPPSPGLLLSNKFWILIPTSYHPPQSYFFLGRLQALCFSHTGKYHARR